MPYLSRAALIVRRTGHFRPCGLGIRSAIKMNLSSIKILKLMPTNRTTGKKSVARTRGRPTPEQSAQLEERLRQAAVDLFVENGFDATTMEAIAKAAGITKRTLYSRYTDKAELFTDAVRWATSRYRAPERLQQTGTLDLEAELLAIGRAAAEWAQDPAIVRLSRLIMIEAARIKPTFAERGYATTASPRIAAVVNLLTLYKNSGAIEVDDVQIAAELFIAMVYQRVAWLAMTGATRPAEVEERYMRYAVKLFLRSIKSSPTTRRSHTTRKHVSKAKET